MKRTISLIFIQSVAVASLALYCSASAGQTAVLRAKIIDIDGNPVAGVKVFLYESANVRKPADFISPQSEKNGMVAVTVPNGKYWAVARLKKDALYGPLMLGDKHSGEPVEIDFAENLAVEAVFVVADIREVGQKKRTNNSDTVRLWGRVVDSEGKPVAGAYVFAHHTREIEFVPDYLSAWTDESGKYTLYLPYGGKFFLGGVQPFPPRVKPSALTVFEPQTGKLDIATDIQLIVY